MKTTKAAQKKAPKGKRRDYRLPPRPMYPESYVYARGSRSAWRRAERNA
jgi:hypothetical protein